MAVSRSLTLWNVPRRIAWQVMIPKKISTMFSQLPLVGVKWLFAGGRGGGRRAGWCRTRGLGLRWVSAMLPFCQFFTFIEWLWAMEIIDSMLLVERSVRARVGDTPRRSTVDGPGRGRDLQRVSFAVRVASHDGVDNICKRDHSDSFSFSRRALGPSIGSSPAWWSHRDGTSVRGHARADRLLIRPSRWARSASAPRA